MASKIYGHDLEDGTFQILADCPLYQDAIIKFLIPAAAAEVYFGDTPHGKHIQDLFPDLHIEQREILKSGHSPAQWDQMRGLSMPKTVEEFQERYRPMGYVFEGDETTEEP